MTHPSHVVATKRQHYVASWRYLWRQWENTDAIMVAGMDAINIMRALSVIYEILGADNYKLNQLEYIG